MAGFFSSEADKDLRSHRVDRIMASEEAKRKNSAEERDEAHESAMQTATLAVVVLTVAGMLAMGIHFLLN